jgi:hypothetical protein
MPPKKLPKSFNKADNRSTDTTHRRGAKAAETFSFAVLATANEQILTLRSLRLCGEK